MPYTYCDLKIDSTFDIENENIGEPTYIYDLDVIKQDLRHLLLESGLLESVIGERNVLRRAVQYRKLTSLIETDKRIYPGSVVVSEHPEKVNTVYIYAKTIAFGDIAFGSEVAA